MDLMESHPPIAQDATVRVQFVLAAVMWTAASMMLGIRSVGWLAHLHFGALFAIVALILGWIKQHYVMRRVAGNAIVRIQERGPKASVFGFFAIGQWLLVAVMMGVGIALRLSGLVPLPVLGTLYATVSIGLLLGSGRFWQAVALGG
jgi:uncharacterized membrane protein